MRHLRAYLRKHASALKKIGFFLIFLCIVANTIVVLSVQVIIYQAVKLRDTTPAPFPIGVDPSRELIVENPKAESYFKEHIAAKTPAARTHTSWFTRAVAKLAQFQLYQNFASPSGRVLVIQSGERKEEVAENFGKILGWDRNERQTFMDAVATSTPQLAEGKFAPYTYLSAKDAAPNDVAALIIDRFESDVLSRYTKGIDELVPLESAFTIASLLEREGRDFEDMREISGIIWNRLFNGMKLQLDATLQYAKGSRIDQPWWPKVTPGDKNIASPYNTYKNTGLPPAPIANPSLDAILAALNPKKTDCMFYFHDSLGEFHCAQTYEEHVALLKEYYGRGK